MRSRSITPLPMRRGMTASLERKRKRRRRMMDKFLFEPRFNMVDLVAVGVIWGVADIYWALGIGITLIVAAMYGQKKCGYSI